MEKRRRRTDWICTGFAYYHVCFFCDYYGSPAWDRRQSIEYTTYSAARAAVICENQNQAQSAAELIVNDMIYEIPGVEPRSASVTIQNYMGSTWQKGGLINCTVEVKVNTISPWSSSIVTSDITMMIERPGGTAVSVMQRRERVCEKNILEKGQCFDTRRNADLCPWNCFNGVGSRNG